MAKKAAKPETAPMAISQELIDQVARMLVEATAKPTETKPAKPKESAPAMKMKAWVHQLKGQVEKHGESGASWYVSWIDPDGKPQRKSCGSASLGKKAADRLAEKIHCELSEGTYQARDKKTWKEFREKFDKKIGARFSGKSLEALSDSLDAFAKVSKPRFVTSVTSELVDNFATERLKGKGIKGGTISPATVNKDLRYIRLAMRVAHDWGYVARVPKIRFLKVSDPMPTYVSMDHFTAIYSACESASLPGSVPNVAPSDWWRALIVTAYMTGWRIGQLLSLKWADVDLDGGTALTRADVSGNKGKRDMRIPLHPMVVDHLRRIEGSFDPRVFPWNQNRRSVWNEFERIQQATKLADGTPLPQAGKSGWYGFHDLRRAFATENAAKMDLFELQALMQHKALATTQGYVNMQKRLSKPVENLSVPKLPRTGETG